MDKRGSGNVRAPIKRGPDGENTGRLLYGSLHGTDCKVADLSMAAFCMLAPIRICLGRKGPVADPDPGQNVFAD